MQECNLLIAPRNNINQRKNPHPTKRVFCSFDNFNSFNRHVSGLSGGSLAQ